MRVFLTGANGLLGYNILLRLLDKRHEVVAVVRRAGEMPESLKGLTVVEGDFTDSSLLQREACTCDAIIHCAAVTDMSLPSYEDYLAVNRDGTERLLQAAAQLHIGTFVYVSSANTIGYGSASQPATEANPMEEPFKSSFYARSKQEAEQLVLRYGEERDGLHYVILNPGFMIGAHDSKPSSGRLILSAWRKPVMFVPTGGKSFVPVSDVAVAAVNALTKGRHGQRYLLTADSLTLRQFFDLLRTIGGYRQWIVPLAKPLAMAVGRVGDMLRRLGVRTQLSTNNISQLYAMEYYDNTLATAELDMPHSTLANAIRDFIEYSQAVSCAK
ncbi:MAG: NAD-dependent epimerase/dehydratase family protein [Bacteroidales bacterium]|nr:NAD-dependent epimerase/dehydratase family protein [Bacteroidales bacterium]